MGDKTSDKLLPCPCCGHDNIYEVTETEELTGVTIPALFCNACKIIFKVENDSPYLDDDRTFEYLREKTIKAWNTRKPIDDILTCIKTECISIEDAIRPLVFKDRNSHKKAMELREKSILLHRLRTKIAKLSGLNT